MYAAFVCAQVVVSSNIFSCRCWQYQWQIHRGPSLRSIGAYSANTMGAFAAVNLQPIQAKKALFSAKQYLAVSGYCSGLAVLLMQQLSLQQVCWVML
jgi:hypothetical protein